MGRLNYRIGALKTRSLKKCDTTLSLRDLSLPFTPIALLYFILHSVLQRVNMKSVEWWRVPASMTTHTMTVNAAWTAIVCTAKHVTAITSTGACRYKHVQGRYFWILLRCPIEPL